MLIVGCPRGRGVSGPAAMLVLYGREDYSCSKTVFLNLADFLEQQLMVVV